MTTHIERVVAQIKPIIVEQGLPTTELDAIEKFAVSMKQLPTHGLWVRLQRYIVALALEHTKEDNDELPQWLQRVIEATKIQLPT